MANKLKTSITLSRQVIAILDRLSRKLGMSKSTVIALAVAEYDKQQQGVK